MNKWFHIQNAAQSAEILIYGDIASEQWDASETTAQGFLEQLNALTKAPEIHLRINSGGGSVFAGLAIYNALKRHPAKITTHIDGVAASIASIVALAGDRVLIADNALMMIHEPWAMSAGTATDLRKSADLLDQVKSNMLDIYQSRMTASRNEIALLMANETWFDAQTAIDVGLAGEIETATRMAASIDLSRFRNYPMTEKATDTKLKPVTAETVLAAERKRRDDINGMFFGAILNMEGIAELKAELLDDMTCTVDMARQRVLNKLGEGLGPVMQPVRVPDGTVATHRGYFGSAVPFGGHGADDYQAAVTDALLIRHGIKVQNPHPAARDFAHASITDVAREMLNQSGNKIPWGGSNAIIKAAITHTTSDFPSLLSGLTGKALMMGFENEPASHRQWCNFTNAADFKTQTRVKLGGAPALVKVPEGAEYQHGSMSEEAEAFALESYGRIFSITRQALVNDDLSAFTRIPQAFGQSARRKEADLVYSIITTNGNMADGNPLFDAAHNNLLSAAALSVASLGAAKAAMRKQTGVGGVGLLNIVPRYLIVPAALETTAEQIISSLRIKLADDSEVDNLSWIRQLELVVEPRLDADSATAWYLAGSWMQVDTVEVAHLDGQDAVEIVEEQGFDIAGMRMRATLDVAAKAIDWRGVTKNPGS